MMTCNRLAAGLLTLSIGVILAGCGGGGPSSTLPTSAAATTLPPTPATNPATTSLTIAGVGPGVNETPFYPTTTVTSVTCGTSPTGGFVEVSIPGGGPPTPSFSALADPTIVVVIPGKAVLKDGTGKVLYEMDMPSITTSPKGALVLSLTNVTSISGGRKTIEAGAVNVEGNYACPAGTSAFPGV